MTYVTDQTSAELRVHMRGLKRMQGWHEPLADRLFKEVVEQDVTIKKLEGALAAAEARNATLTDEAARVERNRDMWKDQCAAQAATLATVTPLVREMLEAHYGFQNAQIAFLTAARAEEPDEVVERLNRAYQASAAELDRAAGNLDAFLSVATKEARSENRTLTAQPAQAGADRVGG